MPESPRVLLPGDSAQGLCQLMTTVLWRHTHLYIRQNNNNNNNSSSSSSSNSVAILAQDCQRTNREVYSSFDGLFFWEAPRSASASGGVHLTRAHSDPIASACGDPVGSAFCGVHRARSSRVRGTSACGGVHRARSSRVPCASTSGGVHRAPLQPCTLCQHQWWSSSRPVQPCTRHQRLLWSTSRLFLPCTRHLLLRQPCPKRRRQVRSLSRLQPVHSFSLSHQRLQMQRHTSRLSLVPRAKRASRTPTCSLSRRRLVDEAGHVLDVQVERVMRASVARLGYEWRRTKKREKQLAETLLHLSH